MSQNDYIGKTLKPWPILVDHYNLDNATYVFDDDWEAFSQLTKSEIINGGLAKARIVHDRKWAVAIRSELNAIKI